jgi:hypothetical protein
MRRYSENIKAVTRQLVVDEYEDAPPPQDGEEMPF